MVSRPLDLDQRARSGRFRRGPCPRRRCAAIATAAWPRRGATARPRCRRALGEAPFAPGAAGPGPGSPAPPAASASSVLLARSSTPLRSACVQPSRCSMASRAGRSRHAEDRGQPCTHAGASSPWPRWPRLWAVLVKRPAIPTRPGRTSRRSPRGSGPRSRARPAGRGGPSAWRVSTGAPAVDAVPPGPKVTPSMVEPTPAPLHAAVVDSPAAFPRVLATTPFISPMEPTARSSDTTYTCRARR